jgi:PAS domain S-box-containing protein
MAANAPGVIPGILSNSTILPNEAARIAALHSYGILDTPAEKDFDDLTELASVICQAPISLITFMEADRQWFKSRKGTTETENLRELSFCTHAMASGDPMMVINDSSLDDRFSHNPIVTGEHHITFYAGVPLINKDGFALGSLCVLDVKARTLSKEQESALKIVAGFVVEKLELRRRVNELQEANQKLNESEHRFRNLVQHAPVAIAIYNGADDMVIEQANEHMLNLLGQTEDIIGKPILKARPELKGHHYLDIIKGIFTTGIEHRGANIIAPVRHNGQVIERYFDAIYKPLKNEKNEVTAVMVVASDVTEKYFTDQRKDDFLSIASHELKTPITSLKVGLQLLNMIKDKPTSPMHLKLIEQANRSMDKISDLVDNLLNVKRMTDGELKIDKTTFNVAQMLHNSCAHVRVAGKYNLHIQSDSGLSVFADEHRIEQVVINFVNNAIKYAPDSPDIYIIVENRDTEVRISVKDNGPGIEKNKLPYIFERYFQADNSNASYNGLGLGLYICSEIVRKHEGNIGVESEMGKGCTFWFSLPRTTH